jgi:hypothetical protein
MFDKKYEERLAIWSQFRESLETAIDPIQDTIDFFSTAPISNLAADPYSSETWPDPWELIEENNYCPFVKILAISYTLQLTDKFSQSTFEIHITQDQERSTSDYLLMIDDRVVGLAGGDVHVSRDNVPETTYSKCVHEMPKLH